MGEQVLYIFSTEQAISDSSEAPNDYQQPIKLDCTYNFRFKDGFGSFRIIAISFNNIRRLYYVGEAGQRARSRRSSMTRL